MVTHVSALVSDMNTDDGVGHEHA